MGDSKSKMCYIISMQPCSLLSTHATCAPAQRTPLMILLLLFLQKQSLAFAVYLFGIGTLLTGPGLKKKAHVIMPCCCASTVSALRASARITELKIPVSLDYSNNFQLSGAHSYGRITDVENKNHVSFLQRSSYFENTCRTVCLQCSHVAKRYTGKRPCQHTTHDGFFTLCDYCCAGKIQN